jgi:hypothetical protein
MNGADTGQEEAYTATQRPPSLGRATTSLALRFLELALADGPVAVTDIETKARAACLLGPTQKITDAKLFKRSKRLLHIRSVRVGFGGAGSWCWELPMRAPPPGSERPPQPATKDVPAGATYVERWSDPEQSCAESGAEVGFLPVQMRGSKAGGISRIDEVGDVATWIAGVAILDPNRAVAGIPPLRWRQFIHDCKAFLDPAKGWAEAAYGKGWSTLDLFGCNPSQPLAHLGVAGLLWAVNGGRVIEIHRGWALIEQANNGSRRNFDQRRSRQASLTLPWWIR